MKKKIIFGVVLLILAILLTLGIKNYVIIQSLEKKFEEYANKDNYHIYNFVHQANGLKTTRDEYKKGNNSLIAYYSSDINKGLLSKVYKNDAKKVNYITIYSDSKTTNIVNEDFKDETNVEIISYLKDLSFGDKLRLAVSNSLKTEKYNGKEVYRISGKSLGNEYENVIECLVEKETGLVVYVSYESADEKDKDVEFTEMYYEFDNVDDSIFVQPDKSNFEVENNQ